jgi:hypothetical protein
MLHCVELYLVSDTFYKSHLHFLYLVSDTFYKDTFYKYRTESNDNCFSNRTGVAIYKGD